MSELAARVEPSARGEYEITDLNRMYLEDRTLDVVTLGRGYAWLDTGTMESLYEAGEFVRTVERAQDLPVSVPEEIAYENGWVSRERLLACAERYGKSDYGRAPAHGRRGRHRPQREVRGLGTSSLSPSGDSIELPSGGEARPSRP